MTAFIAHSEPKPPRMASRLPSYAEIQAGLDSENRVVPIFSLDSIHSQVVLYQLARGEKVHIPDPENSDLDKEDLRQLALRDLPQHSQTIRCVRSGHPDAARYIHLLVPGEDEDEFWREVVAELAKRDAQKP